MRTNPILRAVICAALLLVPLVASAQYSIDWYKISGGGGSSTGGVYSVSGTIGQADAGTVSGDNYTLTGGFWSAISVVQTEGAPLLSLAYPSPGSVSLAWPLTTGWQLEQTTSLSGNPPPWGLVSPSGYQTNSGQVSITLTILPGNRFYRLHRP